MSVPAVVITQLDNQLGIVPSSQGKPLLIIGACTGGTANTAVVAARQESIVSALTSGPACELAATWVSQYGRAAIVIPTATTVEGDYGTVTEDNEGTAVITAGTSEPLDDYEVIVEFMSATVVGTSGSYRYSVDGGANYSPTIDLDTDDVISIPGTGVTVDLGEAADTITAGTVVSFTTTAPQWNTAELTAALTAARNNDNDWEIGVIVGPVAAADIDAIGAAVTSLASVGKYRSFICHTRMPNVGETESEYLTAMTTLISAKSDTSIEVVSGAAKVVSSISGRVYRRPAMFATAPFEASLSSEQNPASPELGSLRATITSANGDPVEHDELLFPGLDDQRLTVLRTIPGLQGVYINRARLIAATGSDFRLHAHRRVFNEALAALNAYAVRRLNKIVRVNKATGLITERDRLEIESGAYNAVATAVMSKPKASGIIVSVANDDNVLSTSTITMSLRIIPLGYSEYFQISVGFTNPTVLAV